MVGKGHDALHRQVLLTDQLDAFHVGMVGKHIFDSVLMVPCLDLVAFIRVGQEQADAVEPSVLRRHAQSVRRWSTGRRVGFGGWERRASEAQAGGCGSGLRAAVVLHQELAPFLLSIKETTPVHLRGRERVASTARNILQVQDPRAASWK
jgi:hypothetical protein